MAVIVLPSDPAPNGATPMLRDFGGTLTPFLGGPEQRINRLGTRLGIRVSMPPMRNGDNGRIFVSRLLQAKQDRLLMDRSEEHTSELQSLMRISYAVFCLKKKIDIKQQLTRQTS